MKALSIRQPWAWLICNAGKDIENRNWPTRFRGRVLIHAGKTMTRADYEVCVIYCSGLPDGTLREDFRFPMFDELKDQCGGIIGETEIIGCVTESESVWFCGEYGFVLQNSKPLPFTPCKGSLSFFEAIYPASGGVSVPASRAV